MYRSAIQFFLLPKLCKLSQFMTLFPFSKKKISTPPHKPVGLCLNKLQSQPRNFHCVQQILLPRIGDKFNVFGSVHLCKVQWGNKLMQLLIVFISYLVNTQHVSSDIRSSLGVLFTVHTASGCLYCYLSVALSCVLTR
jgi:hypothetical protein